MQVTMMPKEGRVKLLIQNNELKAITRRRAGKSLQSFPDYIQTNNCGGWIITSSANSSHRSIWSVSL